MAHQAGPCIGPVLPPGFLQGTQTGDDESHENEQCPAIRVVIPSELGKPTAEHSEDPLLYGPALPPGLRSNDGSSIIGPTLPPQFTKGANVTTCYDSDSGDDEGMIGPMTSEAALGNESHSGDAEEIERRSQKMKDKLLGRDQEESAPRAREEWMTELPTNMGRKLGLGPRTFSRRELPSSNEDRSAWTDSPLDKEMKLRGESSDSKRAEQDTRSIIEEARNQELGQQLKKYNKSKRKESLMDIHKKKRRKEKEKTSSEPIVRREFDRDQDLGVSRMDPLKAKRAIDGAKLLNGRFSHGSSHFL